MTEELPEVRLVDGAIHIVYDGWELTITRGQYDDVPVLFIDTATQGAISEEATGAPRCRILLNDEPLWENPPFSLPDDPALLDPDDRPREV